MIGSITVELDLCSCLLIKVLNIDLDLNSNFFLSIMLSIAICISLLADSSLDFVLTDCLGNHMSPGEVKYFGSTLGAIIAKVSRVIGFLTLHFRIFFVTAWPIDVFYRY